MSLPAIAIILLLPLAFFATGFVLVSIASHESLDRLVFLGGSAPSHPLPKSSAFLPNTQSETLSPSEEALLEHYRRVRPDLSEYDVRLLLDADAVMYFTFYSNQDPSSSDTTEMVAFTDITFEVHLLLIASTIIFFTCCIATVLVFHSRHQALQILDLKDKALDELYTNASHELKTPLASISAHAIAAQSGAIAMDRGFGAIAQEADRMARTIDEIIDLSKLRAKVATPSFETCDLRETAFDCLAEIAPQASLLNLKIHTNMPEPVLCTVDETMMIKAIRNLLSNALRYSSTSIDIALYKTGEHITIAVRNDGPPITKDNCKSDVFDRFSVGSGGQTGIGLAVASENVRLHGGSITAQPLDNGTEMRIELPAHCSLART